MTGPVPSQTEIRRTSHRTRTPTLTGLKGGTPVVLHRPVSDSPVFVHVDSPHESPLLGRSPVGTMQESSTILRSSDDRSVEGHENSPTLGGEVLVHEQVRESSPVWVRLVDCGYDPRELERCLSPLALEDYDDSSNWLPVSVTPVSSPTPVVESGTPVSKRRRSGESPLPALQFDVPETTRTMSRSYSNPYRQTSYRIERRTQTVQPQRGRIYF